MSEVAGRKRIILLLDQYPFGTGEYSFIKTELEFLLDHFEVSIISTSAFMKQKMLVDDRITLYHCVRKFGIKEKILAVFRFIMSKYGRYEIKQIFKSRASLLGRLYDSVVYYECADQLRKYVRKNSIICDEDTLIYSYWFNANCLAFLLDKKVYPGIKVVSRMHGYDLYNERNPHNRQPFREYMDSEVDKIFFVAETGLQYYIKHWKRMEVIDKKYLVSPIGTVNREKIEVIGRSREKRTFKIVSCSNVIALKRVGLIVEALSLIDDIEISWTHYGTGNLLDEIKEQAAQLLMCKKNISYDFRGYVPVEKIMNFYNENYVDCFLTTSSTEGCPVSIQEAMSYGIPIVGTAVGEIPNMIAGNGFLLSESPLPEDVCGAIHYLYSCTEEQICEMRRRSRHLWENKYNALNNAANFVNELEIL